MRRSGVPSLAERLEGACAALEVEPGLVSLPSRLALFGLTRLPVSHLRVLQAIGRGRDVHLMLLHPSPAMWSSGQPKNRLLSSWGRDVHGLQTLVHGLGEDVHHSLPQRAEPTTVLEALQRDVHADRRPPGPPLRPGQMDSRFELSATDRSIRVHACHGRARQVEVLREAILHRLADDPTLEPRDVIVMCPDIESFAPLIEATFGGRVAEAVVGPSAAPGAAMAGERSTATTVWGSDGGGAPHPARAPRRPLATPDDADPGRSRAPARARLEPRDRLGGARPRGRRARPSPLRLR